MFSGHHADFFAAVLTCTLRPDGKKNPGFTFEMQLKQSSQCKKSPFGALQEIAEAPPNISGNEASFKVWYYLMNNVTSTVIPKNGPCLSV